MSMMQEVLRITDRFMDPKDPDSIDAHSHLGQMCVLVMVFYVIMFIGFVKMQEVEHKHPRRIIDVDVTFEFSAPPPDPTLRVGMAPKPISLVEGENANSGSEAAPKPMASDTTSLPTIKAPETLPTPTQIQARPKFAVKETESAPVAVTTTNELKAAPTTAPKTAPIKTAPSNTAGVLSTLPVSGAAEAGGTPDAGEGGSGTGGQGTGGTGTGAGDPGAGSGLGTAGGVVATNVESTGARAMGNIAPYRKSMLVKLAQNWHPKRKFEDIIVKITINHEGKLVEAEIVQSSGNRKADEECLSAIEATDFDPLPEWFKGESLPFKISMNKVEAAQQ